LGHPDWLIHEDQRGAVFDVIVDGVSLALNDRAQCAQITQSASSDTLRQRIKGMVAEESAERATRDRLHAQRQ
jgi:hypothetical protein